VSNVPGRSPIEGQKHLDRTFVVTGGASGVGRGIALRFAEEGADVVVADVQRDPIAGKYFDTDATVPTDRLLEEEHPRESLFVETDVIEPDAVEKLIDETVGEFGALDFLSTPLYLHSGDHTGGIHRQLAQGNRHEPRGAVPLCEVRDPTSPESEGPSRRLDQYTLLMVALVLSTPIRELGS
jgi:hypothetical protein